MPPPDTKAADAPQTTDTAQPDTHPRTVEAQVTADRLKEWKERRARIAETSRNERLRLAEEERRERIKQAEKEREERVREASQKRARQIAQEKADRLEAARAKLVGRAEIDAARERLVHYRARSARALIWRITTLILLPTIAVAAYLFAVATPLYEAETTLALRSTAPLAAEQTPDTDRPVFTLPAGTEAAHQVRAIMLSEPTLRAADSSEGLTAHFSGAQMDPIRRLRDLSAIQRSQTDQLSRFISADVRAFEGLITLSVLARSPQKAEDISRAILTETEASLARVSPQHAQALITVVPPTADTVATSPGRIGGTILAALFFTALYAAGAILLATLRRHAWT